MVGEVLYNAIYSAFTFFLSEDMLLSPIWHFLVESTAFLIGLFMVIFTFGIPVIIFFRLFKKGGKR